MALAASELAVSLVVILFLALLSYLKI